MNISNIIEYLEYIEESVGDIPVKVIDKNRDVLDINMIYDKNNVAYIIVGKKENSNIDRIKSMEYILDDCLKREVS